jgi:hypothetical protein
VFANRDGNRPPGGHPGVNPATGIQPHLATVTPPSHIPSYRSRSRRSGGASLCHERGRARTSRRNTRGENGVAKRTPGNRGTGLGSFPVRAHRG